MNEDSKSSDALMAAVPMATMGVVTVVVSVLPAPVSALPVLDAFLPKLLQRLAHGRPLGLRRLERPVATFNVRLCLLHGGAGVVEFGLGRGEGVGGVLRGFLQRCLLAGELADLGGLLAVFLLDQIEVASGGDGRGVRLAQAPLRYCL